MRHLKTQNQSLKLWKQKGLSPIGAVGFCWGGDYLIICLSWKKGEAVLSLFVFVADSKFGFLHC